ncbi:MAG: RagB/SusD family nutrient uptake outer membrane protein, partial [Bacteroidales bacterium]
QSWQTALDLVNRIRQRAGLDSVNINVSETDEMVMLDAVMNEWTMEFLAEGKHWYNLLRMGRYDKGDGVYKERFINEIIESNQTTKDEWIKSVLMDENAWYMPIPYSEISVNENLVQNPYYKTTK